ncbi:MAG: PilZ domain-containing protein [Isosphaeraceae bacterium]|nr:PilZ domain-containing protein [Isosphaeraceae bacterium]
MSDRRKSVNDFFSDRRRGPDRRRSSRYDTRSLPIWLTWQQGERRGCGQGRLRDLSVSGASVLTEESPPLGARVQIRLETCPSAPQAEGAVLRVMKTRRFLAGPLVVSLRFASPCPYEFFTAAIYRA